MKRGYLWLLASLLCTASASAAGYYAGRHAALEDVGEITHDIKINKAFRDCLVDRLSAAGVIPGGTAND